MSLGFASLRIQEKTNIDKSIRELLDICRTQIRDGIIVGYDDGDLLEPAQTTIDRITAVLGDKYDIETGDDSRD